MKRTNTIYSRFTRFFCLVLALHFLNCSIDSKDPNPEAIPEDLTFNDIESVTEFMAEIVFGFNNAFEEHDEKDAEDGSSLDVLKFYFLNYPITISHKKHHFASDAKYILRNSSDILSPIKEITSPPPKA
jgi:hypothetical protein